MTKHMRNYCLENMVTASASCTFWAFHENWISVLDISRATCLDHRSLNIWKSFCKKKFLHRMGPVFRASLWPDQWTHRVPIGIERNVWKLPFHLYSLVFCGLSGLDATATQSKTFFQKVENAENWPTLFRGETQLFGNFLMEILTWNQCQMKLKTPNFHGKKEACQTTFRVNQDGFPCQSRFPWLCALKCHISVSMFELTTKRTKLCHHIRLKDKGISLDGNNTICGSWMCKLWLTLQCLLCRRAVYFSEGLDKSANCLWQKIF